MNEVRGTEPGIGPVDLTVRATSDHLRILRLVTSTLAASVGLDVDQLDDLRIAVDELCSLLIEHATPDSLLRLKLREQDGRLVGEGSLLAEVSVKAVDPVSQMILDGLDVEWSIEAPSPSFCLTAPSRQSRDVT